MFDALQTAHSLLVARTTRIEKLVKDFENGDNLLDPADEEELIGLSAYYSGDYIEAVDRLNRAVAIRPSARVFTRLSSAYIWLQSPKSALAAADEALNIDPHESYARANKGRALLQLEEYKSAVVELLKAQVELHDDLTVLRSLFCAYIGLSDIVLAQSTIEKWLELDPDSIEASALARDLNAGKSAIIDLQRRRELL